MVDTDIISLEDRFDATKNVAAAYQIYLGAKERTGDGFTAWSAYNNGRYLNWM